MTTHRVLPNGLTLLLRESRRAPVVELQIWAAVGSADERPGEEGLAHFHEHMLFKGTERRDVGEVAGDIEGLGGQINAYTSFDQTVYHATLPSDAWRQGLDVLTDAVRFSIFDDEELARESEVVLEEIRRSDDTPGHVLSDLAFEACYPTHPYGQPILGPAENVAGFNRAQVRRFFERWYTPDNLMVVAVGDFNASEVEAEIERLFTDAATGQAKRNRVVEPPQNAMRVALLRRPFEGHRVDLSWPASPFEHRDTTYLDLLAYLLGECESSRLVRRVRERDALVDRIDAGAYTPLDRGLFSIGFETNAARFLPALSRVIEETDRLRREPVSEAELERARINFLASEHFERESVSGIASKLGSYESLGGGWMREAEAIEMLRAATPADLLEVAQRYLSPEGLTFSALIPEARAAGDPEISEEAIREAVASGLASATHPGTHAPEAAESQPSTTARSAPTAANEHSRLRFGPMRPTLDGAGERFDAELPNGLKVHVLRRPEVPIVSARLACPGGLISESPSTSGLTRFTSAMWSRGTERHDAATFTREVEALAADVEGFSGRNSIGLTLDCLSETLEPAFDLFADALLEPRFDADEIQRERRETLAALDRREDRLGQRAFQLFTRTEYGDHPYGMTLLGERDSVESFTATDLRTHADRLVSADRAAIAIVGDVDPEQVGRMIERRFMAMPSAALNASHDSSGDATYEGTRQTRDSSFVISQPAERGPGVIERSLRKDRAQAHLVLGFRGVKVSDPDRHALELISQLLAGQGGRLFLELRDRQSLAYTVSASNVEGLCPGYFSIYIATAPEKMERARAGILEEMERLINEAPSREELDRAIRYGTGSFAIESQRNHGRAAHLALDSIYGLGPDHTEAYPSDLAGLTPEDLLRVARRIFRLDAYTVSAVHP